MGKLSFKVNISPDEALELVAKGQSADLVHQELFDLGDGRYIGTLIFEKYYMRVKNRAALVVICDNFQGETEVRAVATGSSQGMIFNFDWGAAGDFVNSVKRILKKYII